VSADRRRGHNDLPERGLYPIVWRFLALSPPPAVQGAINGA